MTVDARPLLVIAGVGLIGRRLAELASEQGWRVRLLRHRNSAIDTVYSPHTTFAPTAASGIVMPSIRSESADIADRIHAAGDSAHAGYTPAGYAQAIASADLPAHTDIPVCDEQSMHFDIEAETAGNQDWEIAYWNPYAGLLNPKLLAGAACVVCLNGAPIAARPWSAKRKRILWDSRIASVDTIAKAVATLAYEDERNVASGHNAHQPVQYQAPSVVITGSATGYYGDAGDSVCDESASRGEGFLADLCEAWEHIPCEILSRYSIPQNCDMHDIDVASAFACENANVGNVANCNERRIKSNLSDNNLSDNNLPDSKPSDSELQMGSSWHISRPHIRLVQLRTAYVISGTQGIAPVMHTLYKCGFGAQLGNGRQWQSYIHIDDAARAILYAATHDEIKGPINLASPNPITQREFHHLLCQRSHSMRWVSVPHFAMRIMGEMSTELLLSSQRAVPMVLEQAGFSFLYPTVAEQWDAAFAR